jgi:serine/threonine-protein kinase HipA
MENSQNKCLYCYENLSATETDFHAKCSKKIFGQAIAPQLPYREETMEELAAQIIRSQVTVTGVQPKLSLHLAQGQKNEPSRFTIVGLWGNYILKPPTSHYPQLPEVEDLTMHLARIAKISVVPHCLIRLQSGNLAYLTKRIDREKKTKLHMEDMCQLTERLTEHKYHGSYEQIAKTIRQYSANPGLDVINFFEIVLFSFLTGNADMHLKNFSMLHLPNGAVLSPAYDLVATALVNPADTEDTALMLNGKKRKLKRNDFVAAFQTLQIDAKQQANIFKKMEKAKPEWLEFIKQSFLSPDFKAAFVQLIETRFERLAV